MEKSLQIISEKSLTAAQQTAGAPVVLNTLRVAYDYTYNREVLFIGAVNQSGNTLRSLYFDLACTDDAGDPLGVANGACIRSLSVAPGDAFGEDIPVVIPYAGTCNVELTLKKAVFADGTVWREGDAPVATEQSDTPATKVSAPAPETVPTEPAAIESDPGPEPTPTPVPDEPTPVVIPDEWLNPPATVEGYRAAAEGLMSLENSGKPYLIKKFTALADKLEAETAEAARKAAEAELAAKRDADYRMLLARKPETADEWDALAADWSKLGTYKDTARRADEAKKKARSIRTSEKRLAAKRAEEEKQAALAKAARRKHILKISSVIGGAVLATVLIFVLIFAVMIPASRQEDYEQAEAYLANGEYTAAISAFEALDGYKDSVERAKTIRKELTGREDGIFMSSSAYPCYSIENGVLSYDSSEYYISGETLKVPDYLDDQKVTSISNSCFVGLKNVHTVILPPSVTSIGSSAFADCAKLTTFQGENLVSIGAEAFRGCTALTEFTVPSKVTSIGANAFQGCTALKKVALPAGVHALADGLFLNCTSLSELSFDDLITSIGAETFAYCTSLTALTLPETVKTIGNNAFLYCTGLTTLSIPDSVTAMGDKAMAGCTALTEVSIGSGLSQIPTRTFEGCKALQTVRLPAVTRVGYAAFLGCTTLSDLYYAGSAEDFAKVEILTDNESLTSAAFHGAN
ncbi:MAG: leucine-rich repeat protein [Clostridia bacterium]|nr:leucine-rich repeat protein [Clostridia bacterium]